MADIGFQYYRIVEINGNNYIEDDGSMENHPDIIWMEKHGDRTIYDECCNAVWYDRCLYASSSTTTELDGLKETERFDSTNDDGNHVIITRTYERRGESLHLINAEWKHYEDEDDFEGTEFNNVEDADDDSAIPDTLFEDS